jgi:hypothetical protein
MADGYKVERERLERHAAALDRQRDEWNTTMPNALHGLYTAGVEFTVAGIDLVSDLESLRSRYANDIVPGICSLMTEVVAALHSVQKSYGDAEEASTVAKQGDRLPQHQTPGSNLGDILNQGIR